MRFIFRKLFRNRIYSVINMVGLVMALTAVLLLYSRITKEFQMDRFHENGEEIYRVILKRVQEEKWSSVTSGPTAPYAKQEIPGIREYVRTTMFLDFAVQMSEDEDLIPGNSGMYADLSFFGFFNFPLVWGHIDENGTGERVVISQKMARRYFGETNPVGQPIRLKVNTMTAEPAKEYTVVAVMKDFPATSSIQADVVVDFSALEKDWAVSWGAHSVYTFFRIEPHGDVPAIEKAIPEMIERHYHYIKASEQLAKLQRLEDVYFESGSVESDGLLRGSKQLTLILCGIGLLILVLASCNYLMIRVAQLNRNFAEFAIQRCYGAGNGNLKKQLFFEIGIYLFFAFCLAFLLVYLVHPYFIAIISPHHPYVLHFSMSELLLFILLLIFWGAAIGFILCAYVIRRLNREGIRGSIQSVSGVFDLKTMLALLQMFIFCFLLFCSIVLSRQMDYIREKELGFDNEHVLQFTWPDREYRFEWLQEQLLKNPGVVATSMGESLPGDREGYKMSISLPDAPERVAKGQVIIGDATYIDTYQIRLLEGVNINRESYSRNPNDFFYSRPESHSSEALVNKKLVEQLGLKDPLGTILRTEGRERFKIVGVVDDFHFLPLYHSVEPVVIAYDRPMVSSSLLVRYRPESKQQVLDYIGKLYKEKFPDALFDYQEYRFSDLYEKDMTFVQMIHILTLVAILIGGMGVFAFSVFMAESKRREVAVRKINGATTGEIIGLLNGVFVWRVLLACGIGLPAAYYVMNRWLQGFAYKTVLDGWIFGLTVGVCLVVVILITSWQVWKISRINPVDSLRKE